MNKLFKSIYKLYFKKYSDGFIKMGIIIFVLLFSVFRQSALFFVTIAYHVFNGNILLSVLYGLFLVFVLSMFDLLFTIIGGYREVKNLENHINTQNLQIYEDNNTIGLQNIIRNTDRHNFIFRKVLNYFDVKDHSILNYDKTIFLKDSSSSSFVGLTVFVIPLQGSYVILDREYCADNNIDKFLIFHELAHATNFSGATEITARFRIIFTVIFLAVLLLFAVNQLTAYVFFAFYMIFALTRIFDIKEDSETRANIYAFQKIPHAHKGDVFAFFQKNYLRFLKRLNGKAKKIDNYKEGINIYTKIKRMQRKIKYMNEGLIGSLKPSSVLKLGVYRPLSVVNSICNVTFIILLLFTSISLETEIIHKFIIYCLCASIFIFFNGWYLVLKIKRNKNKIDFKLNEKFAQDSSHDKPS